MLSQSYLGSKLVIIGCLVSRFCQPVDSLFVFSTVQFIIQLLCYSCPFNCYGSLCYSLCPFVSSMVFLCFRLLQLIEHHRFPGYCLLDCCIPPPRLPFLHGLVTSRDTAVLAALLFHFFRKYCPFRFFIIFHVVDDILGIILSYCLNHLILTSFSCRYCLFYFVLVLRSIITSLCCDTTASPSRPNHCFTVNNIFQ